MAKRRHSTATSRRLYITFKGFLDPSDLALLLNASAYCIYNNSASPKFLKMGLKCLRSNASV